MSTKPRKNRPLIEALEPRLLFSATADIALFDDGADHASLLAQSAADTDLTEIYQPHDNQLLLADDPPSLTYGAVLVFVDTSIDQYDLLVNDIRTNNSDANLQIIYINLNENGVDRISETLAHYSQVSAIHIVSHGIAGEVQLGNQVLSLASLDSYANLLASWKTALGEDADILIYGCDVAATQNGLNLMARLSELTGADVAASNDLTGNSGSGNWELETQVGKIEALSLFAASHAMDWHGILAEVTYINTGVPADPNTSSDTITTTMNPGQTFQYASNVTIDHISVPLKAFAGAAAQTITVQLMDSWTGTVLGAASIAASSLTDSYVMTDFNFAPVALTAFNTYWIKITSTGTDGLVRVAYHPSNVFNDGIYVHNGSGDSSRDLAFKVGASVNQAPAGTNYVIDAPEDTPKVLTAANFGFSDPDGNAFSGIVVSSLTGGGVFSVTGSGPVSVSQFIAIADINAGKLIFTPTANDNATDYARLGFQVRDDGGTANGGINTDQSANTLQIDVSYVNDAPINIVPAGPIVTPEDTTVAITGVSVTDVDDYDLWNIEVTLTVTNGTLNVSGGTAGIAGSGTATVILTGTKAQVNATLAATVNYTPTSNYFGAATFTIHTDDKGAGRTGDTDATDTDVVAINVTSVNDAPTGANNTVTTNEDTDYTFAAGNFGFSDVDSGDSLSGVRIDTLPAAGTLKLSGVAVTAGDVISTANIANLTFSPAANANGASYTSFTFSVRDQSNAFDASPNSMTVDVTAVNDAPTGANNTVTTNEDTDYTFAAGNFGFSDVDSGDSLSGVRIDTLPAAGTLKLSGVAVTAGDVISTANIANLTFSPAANANGASYTSFTFSVRDQSNAFDASPNSMTVDVTAVNDAPTGANNTVTTNEDTDYTFAAGNFGFSDVDSGDSLSGVRIDTLPAAGTLKLSGVAVTAGDVISTANIANLTFSPAANANGASYTSFTFSVRDQSNAFDASPNSMTVDVTAVNDAPTGANNTVTTNEDTDYTFAAGNFGFSDVDSGDSLSGVRIDTLPAAGTLKLSGVAVTAGDVISTANIANLTFSPAANANGASYTSFTFSVRDQSNAFDASPNSMTVDVTAVNDAPTGANNTVTTNEDTDYTFAAGNFGFSDVDSGDSLSGVRIDTLPAAGTLKLSGVAVTAGDVISTANIANLTFSPAANANGASYTSFTFSVRDQSNAFDASPNSMTVDVTAVNDAPTGANNTVTTNEDTDYTFAAGNFGFSDVDSGDSLSGVRIDILPAAGTLKLSGVAVTAGDVISTANIANLTFSPAANANGASYTSFTFSVRDQSNAFDASPNSMTVDVTAVNDAPTGANNTVTTNEDTDYTFAAGNFGFSDVDSGDSLSGVRIDTLPAAGTLKLSGVAVTAGDVISTANIANLTFSPAANANGASYTSFTFSVRDQSNAFDASPNSMTVDVTAVNDAPTGANNTVTTNEDTDYTFAAGNFGFSDVDSGDSLSGVRIDTLPAAGTLKLSGVAVTAGDVISTANIANLTFSPAANANGASYTSFTFSVRDQSNAFDASPNTMTVDVTAVNDAPTGANNTVTTNEDTDYTFAAGNFGFSDVDSGDSLSGVRIDTLPAAGTLKLSGVAVTAGDVISTANIANLTFSPAANANGASYTSFTFSVRDQSNAFDASPNSMTVDVTAVNDAPTGANNTVTTNEDTDYTFAAGNFGFSDVDSGDSLSGVRIDTLPAAGTLKLSGVAVTAGDVISTANIANLTFSPAANANGASYTSFTFSVRDQSNAFDASPNSMTVDVTAVNDAPTGANNTVTTNEDTDYTFATGNFGFSDVDSGDSLSGVRIDTLPAAGTLKLSGVVVTAGDVISTANIANLTFSPAANANGASYTSFTFSVRDQSNAFDASPNTMTVDVTAVNDAPAGSNSTITMLEGASHTLTAANFGFSDTNDSPANAFAAVRIASLPAAGSLTLNGVAVSIGDFVSIANINSGLLVFTPATNGNGSGYANFNFQVQDDGGTTNGGVNLDPTANTLTFDVTSVNDAPAGSNATISMLEGASHTLTAANFGFSDTNDSPANAFAAVRIASLPAAGSLTLNGVAVNIGDFISIANINSNLLVFTPAVNGNGAGYANFNFQVQDDGGTTNGGVNLDPTANTLTFDVTSVNDAPAGSDATINMLEGASYTLTAGNFGFSDSNDSPANNFAAVRIASLPAAGSLTLNGVAVSIGDFVSIANINSNLLVFTPAVNGNGAGYANFTFQVQDDGGTANGGVNLDPTANTLTFNVTAINSAPDGANSTVSLQEDASHVLTAANFGFSDANDSPANSLAAVRIASLPAAGTLTLNGAAVNIGDFISIANINSGLLVFTPAANGNGLGYASFNFQVEDDGGTANGGVNLDPVANTLTFDVSAVNDAPVNTVPGVQITMENTDLIFSSGNGNQIQISDVDAGLNSLEVSLSVINGTFTLAGVTGLTFTTGDGTGDGSMVFTGTLADINAALATLTYSPNTSYTGGDTLSITTRDQGNSGSGGPLEDIDTINITVSNVNDPPTITITPATYSAIEQQALSLVGTGISVSDPDGNPLTLTLAVTGAASQLQVVVGTTGVVISSGNGTNNLVLTGSIAQLNDLLAGNNGASLNYTYAGNSPAASETLTMSVNDGALSANDTVTINITAVNDAPSGTNATFSILEGGAHVFSVANFGFSDAVDSPANAFAFVRIASLPAAGSLTLNGVGVGIGDLIAVADIGSGLLIYTPAVNGNGVGYASFNFQVQDDGGTANGGVDLDPTANTLTFDVTSVNDAPAGADATITLQEGASRTLTAANFGFSDSNDSPANNLAAVRIASLPAVGSLTLNGVAVNAGDFISLANINSGLLVFTPAVNGNGANYASFDFQVQDDGGTTNGGINLDPTANTLTFDVTSVNDAPAGADATISILEGGNHILTAANFGFSDTNDSPAHNFAAVRIASLPAAGNLSLNGAAVNVGDFIAIADINAGLLVYTPAVNGSGVGYANFVFQVQDDGGTANGGVNLDPTANTLSFDVTSINDAPSGTDTTVGLSEGASHSFSTADFGFSDVNDSPVNNFAFIRITTLPALGSLTLNGVGVNAGDIISVADIGSALLVYTPAANGSGANYSSFTFQVQDDGGTANSGVDLDPTANTVTFNITAVNDPPSIDITLTNYSVNEQSILALQGTGISVTDVDNDLLTVTLNGGNSYSQLTAVVGTSGVVISAGNGTDNLVLTGTPAQLNDFFAGNNGATLGYRLSGDTPVASTQLSITVNDGTLTANDTATINITAINDAPVNTVPGPLATNANQAIVISGLSIADVDAGTSSLTVTLAVTQGTLTLVGGSAVIVGSGSATLTLTGTLAAINSSLSSNLTYNPTTGFAGADQLTMTTNDNGATGSGGAQTDIDVVNITVAAVNSAPTNNLPPAQVTAEDTPKIISGLSVSDADAGSGSMTVTLGVAHGVLNISGGSATVVGNGSNSITLTGSLAAINSSLAAALTYSPDANYFGADSLSMVTSDNGNTGSGGNLTASSSLAITVTAVNDLPGTSNIVLTPIIEDHAGRLITQAELLANATDIEGDSLSAVGLRIASGGGQLIDNGNATWTYIPAANANGTIGFSYSVSDGQGLTAAVATLVITPDNDAPTTSPVILAPLMEDSGSRLITQAALLANVQDVDGDILTAGALSISSGMGTLVDNGDGTWTYTPAANDDTAVSFSYTLSDGTVSVAGSASLDITPVNDAPTTSNVTLAPLVEDSGPRLITQAALLTNAQDVDGDVLTASNLVITNGTGQLIDNGDGTWTYTPAANDDTAVSFSYTLSDGTVSIAGSASLDITPVNDAPSAKDLGIIRNLEDAAGDQLNLWAAFSDPETPSSQLIYTLVSNSNSALVTSATIDPASGILQLRYGANQFGISELVLRATDPEGAFVDARLLVDIASVNDVPLTSGIKDVLLNNTELTKTITLANSFSDIEDTKLTYVVVSNSNPNLLQTVRIDQQTGVMTLTAAAKNSGETLITLRATDAQGAWVETSFKVTLVLPVIPTTPDVTNPTTPPPLTTTPDTPTAPSEPESGRPPNPDIVVVPDAVVPQDQPPLMAASSDVALVQVEPFDAQLTSPPDDNNRTRTERMEQARNAEALSTLDASSLLSGLIAPDTGFNLNEVANFNDEVRRVREEMDEAMAQQSEQKAMIAGITFSITTGLLVWSLRASSLLFTLFSMIPLWRGIDPLPILEEVDKRKKELEQQRKDKQKEDKNAKEVGYLFDHMDDQDQRKRTK